MPFRVLAFLLAVVMLLTGFATGEQSVAGPAFAFDQDYAPVDAGHGGGHDGSIDDDRADDLPAQPQSEGMHDLALLETRRAPSDLRPSMVLLHRLGLVALPSPFLEGLQRPPCPGLFLA